MSWQIRAVVVVSQPPRFAIARASVRASRSPVTTRQQAGAAW